ncbi:LysR family transcriptional regulator [Dongia deserti]|uniref:LysR family transcriptional regulator n=1 Tax=Dongia deserti TaxID=2268030 RepID=UPI000E658D52|nr:LysR family transcriptional regulator [Dongia deserti]
MRLDVESLRTFRAVVEAGGVTRAAQRLNLSQSAVSWKLKRLEERVGRPLTVIDARKIALTEDGQALLNHAVRIVDAHDEAVARFQAADLAGEVRVGITEDMAVDGIAKVIGRFSRHYPHLVLSMRIEQSRNLARWLADGEIDAAIIQLRADEVRSSDIVLTRDKLVWVAANDDLGQANPLPLVTFGPDCFYRPFMVRALQHVRRSNRIVVQAPSTAAVKAALLAGLGVGVLRKRQLVEVPDLQPLGSLTAPLPAVAQVLRFSGDLPRRLAGPLRSVITEPALLAHLT